MWSISHLVETGIGGKEKGLLLVKTGIAGQYLFRHNQFFQQSDV
jgi:hypothetical protein